MRMYIRRTLSCCICHVFHSVFSVYVHLMYIFLSLFLVDGFYCVVLLDIVLICCCTPDNDVDSPSPDMGRHIARVAQKLSDWITVSCVRLMTEPTRVWFYHFEAECP